MHIFTSVIHHLIDEQIVLCSRSISNGHPVYSRHFRKYLPTFWKGIVRVQKAWPEIRRKKCNIFFVQPLEINEKSEQCVFLTAVANERRFLARIFSSSSSSSFAITCIRMTRWQGCGNRWRNQHCRGCVCVSSSTNFVRSAPSSPCTFQSGNLVTGALRKCFPSYHSRFFQSPQSHISVALYQYSFFDFLRFSLFPIFPAFIIFLLRSHNVVSRYC